MINCPNPSCKTANPAEADVCQVCQSALPHFYLWGVGDLVKGLRPGTLLNQRYVLKRDRIFLDTKPGLVPESMPDLPGFLMPYLHLSAYPVHVPRPYAVMKTPDDDFVLMLESGALAQGTPAGTLPTLLPTLHQSWADASPLRQLSWLWQIAQLWDAFVAERVAATFLNENLLRVDGSVLRLLELSGPMDAHLQGTDPAPVKPPSLIELGRFWQPLAETAQPAVRAFLDRLCEQMERQQLNAEQLTEQLSQALSVCGQGQSVDYQMAVYTDQGPTRKRNEDACYPESGTAKALSSADAQPQLLIVCDGIGGHQGGDVASKLAIATIQSSLQPILTADAAALTSTEIMLALERAICAANDEISAQNDEAQRQARDRMGTTLVMALVRGADVYIAHLGDSRAYRISEQNCQQVTLDDDVASRQMRLGGSLYREMLVQPGSGSLIQALGMASSQTLRPTVQRFVMDQSCVFLLCSDGLSDSDRVEQFWKTVVKPLVVTGAGTAADVGQKLVDLANRYNGHDNVTVGLLVASVETVSDRIVPRELAVASAIASEPTVDVAQGARERSGRGQTRLMGNLTSQATTQSMPAPERTQPPGQASVQSAATPPVRTQKSAASPADNKSGGGKGIATLAALLALCLALVGGGLYAWRWQRQQAQDAVSGSSGSAQPVPPRPTATSDSARQSAVKTVPPTVPLEIGAYARVRPSDGVGIRSAGRDVTASFSQLDLYPNPGAAGDSAERVIPGTVPTGSIVKVLQKQESPDQSKWVQIQLCSTPGGGSVPAETDSLGASDAQASEPQATIPNQPMVLPLDAAGWVTADKLAGIVEVVKDLEPTQTGNCGG